MKLDCDGSLTYKVSSLIKTFLGIQTSGLVTGKKITEELFWPAPDGRALTKSFTMIYCETTSHPCIPDRRSFLGINAPINIAFFSLPQKGKAGKKDLQTCKDLCLF